MSSSRQINKEMLNLLDKLEENLNKHKSSFLEPSQNNFQSFPSSYNINNNINKFNSMQEYPEYPFRNEQNNNFNNQISPSMEFQIRKIIKDEFNSLIVPYQLELQKGLEILETKIGNNSNKIKDLSTKNLNNRQQNFFDEENIINSNNLDLRENNNKYILRVEYDNKIRDFEHQFSNLNSLYKALKDNIDINSMANNNNNYLGRDEFAQLENKYALITKEIEQIKRNINNINLNNDKMKKDFLGEIQEIKNDFNENIKKNNNNNIAINNNVDKDIQNIYTNINNLKNEFNLFKNQIDVNFINNMKTIVSQQINKNELLEVKNNINDHENRLTDILKKFDEYDKNIKIINNSFKDIENKINNTNISNQNNNNINSNPLSDIPKTDINKIQTIDYYNSIDELKNDIKKVNIEIDAIKILN